MSTNGHETFRWFLVILGCLGLVLSIAKCDMENTKIEQEIKIACIQKGGTWAKLSENTDRTGCKFK